MFENRKYLPWLPPERCEQKVKIGTSGCCLTELHSKQCPFVCMFVSILFWSTYTNTCSRIKHTHTHTPNESKCIWMWLTISTALVHRQIDHQNHMWKRRTRERERERDDKNICCRSLAFKPHTVWLTNNSGVWPTINIFSFSMPYDAFASVFWFRLTFSIQF